MQLFNGPHCKHSNDSAREGLLTNHSVPKLSPQAEPTAPWLMHVCQLATRQRKNKPEILGTATVAQAESPVDNVGEAVLFVVLA